MIVENKQLKILILTDTEEDYNQVIDNYNFGMHNFERLIDESQLQSSSYLEVWDCRKINQLVQEMGLSYFVMPMKEEE